MCPTGHSLFIGSDSIPGRLRWRLHARRCAECGEVRRGEVLTSAAVARGGSWVGPALARTARRWRLVTATASVVVLVVAVPLLGPMMRKPSPRNPAASADRVWTVTATVPQAKDIRTVRFVVREAGNTQMVSGEPYEQLSESAWQAATFSREYPDREREDPSDPVQHTTLVRSGDRVLAAFGSADVSVEVHPEDSRRPYRYMLSRPAAALPSPDLFTDQGAEQAGLICTWPPNGEPYYLGEGGDVFIRQWQPGENGERVLVVQHTKRDDPTFHGTYRIRVDLATHLVRGWDNTVRGTRHPGTAFARQPFIFREVVEDVEYNVTFPDGTFNTAPPEDTAPDDVLDAYTPAGLKGYYLRNIAGLVETRAAGHYSPEAWAELLQTQVSIYSRLDALSPADQAEVRAKAKQQGLDLP